MHIVHVRWASWIFACCLGALKTVFVGERALSMVNHSAAHLANLEKEEFNTATAKSLYEDEELLEAGFEYVTEWDGVKIISKPE